MRRTLTLLAAAVLAVGLVTPGIAAVAIITAAAPVDGQSDEAIQAALDAAVGQAVDGAIQMGYRPLQLTDAQLWADWIVVQVLATDVRRDDPDEAVPGVPPGQHLGLVDSTGR